LAKLPRPPGSSGGEGVIEDGASRRRAIDLAWGCGCGGEEITQVAADVSREGRSGGLSREAEL
jgi:hypothetical protein